MDIHANERINEVIKKSETAMLGELSRILCLIKVT